jgi:hypothetical protein
MTFALYEHEAAINYSFDLDFYALGFLLSFFSFFFLFVRSRLLTRSAPVRIAQGHALFQQASAQSLKISSNLFSFFLFFFLSSNFAQSAFASVRAEFRGGVLSYWKNEQK